MTLQQKLAQADDYLDMLKDKAKETDELAKENLQLRKEIERLKEENNILCSIANGEKEKVDKILELINRINKAIEYIENDLSHATSNGKLHRKHLIDILKGVDKEC